MYESPIELKVDNIVSDVVKQVDEFTLRCFQQIGIKVDRNELIKALEYDRGQYEKGWSDRENDIVRCKGCMWGTDYYHDGDCYCLNPKWGMKYFGGSWNFYCAEAERRKKDEL